MVMIIEPTSAVEVKAGTLYMGLIRGRGLIGS